MANSSPASVAAAVAPAAPLAAGADAEPLARPDGKKKKKQQLRRRSTIEAVDYLMAKKKEADLEKGLKKQEVQQSLCSAGRKDQIGEGKVRVPERAGRGQNY